MRKKTLLAVVGLLALTTALPAQAAEKAMPATSLFFWTILIGSVCLTVAAIVGILGQSKAFCTASDNIARNPGIGRLHPRPADHRPGPDGIAGHLRAAHRPDPLLRQVGRLHPFHAGPVAMTGRLAFPNRGR